ncbi:MAG: lamin tail domain-containing protein [Phycisphaerae bacterium]|nr:lamin tail domain-containing protein [Phycisphaerae bacterium]
MMCRQSTRGTRGASRALIPFLALALVLAASSPTALADVLLNEVVYDPASLGRDDLRSAATRIELYNSGPGSVDLANWTITRGDALPAIVLPPLNLPGGCFLTVYLTGGIDELDFTDGAGELFLGPVGLPFDPTEDECALYNGSPGSGTLVDFVSWSRDDVYLPDVAHDHAVAAGVWTAGAFVPTNQLTTGDSLARYFDGFDRNLPEDWRIVPISLYAHHRAYPVENPIQLSPSNRDVFITTPATFTWMPLPGATTYEFQLATDYTFATTLVYATGLPGAEYTPGLTLPTNVYFWRVRAQIGVDFTPWSAEWMFVVNSDLESLEAQFCRSCPFKYQRKDTNLLCLWNDMDAHTRPGCPEAGSCAWDQPHPNQSPDDSGCRHGRNYCWAASIAMVNGRHGGDLSQDRIAYENWNTQRPEPEGDLGHDRANSDGRITTTLSWALNGAAINYQYVGAGNFTFAQMKQWIDERECFVAAVPGHCLVPTFYFEFTTTSGTNCQIVYAHDPWRGPYHPHVFSYVIAGSPTPYWRHHRTNQFDAVWLQPAAGTTGRMQETSVTTDSDGDGVMDFDETTRALQSLPGDQDTDDDEVPDKEEIRNYTFHDRYHSGHENDALSFSDWDGDGLRSEADCDSDDDSDFDGGEDINGNGHNPEQWETCMFRPADLEITIHVDKDIYLVGEPVYIVDTNARRTRTFHEWSLYWYELGPGYPSKNDGDPIAPSGLFVTNRRGGAIQHHVHDCPYAGPWYLYADVLNDGLYSAPDNWDPFTFWWCIPGNPPLTTPPSTPATPPGCPRYPTPVSGGGSYDPDGPITRWVWTVNNKVLYDGDYPDIVVTLPLGSSEIKLTTYDEDGLSSSAVTTVVAEGGLPLPAVFPMDQQINLHDPSDPTLDAIQVEPPAELLFLNDGLHAFTRVLFPMGQAWSGPIIDLRWACHDPADVTEPGLMLSFAARYYQSEAYPAPYDHAPIYVTLLDSMGYTADLGALYGPQPDEPYPAWQTIEAPLDIIAADDLFDPTQVAQIMFSGHALYVEEEEPVRFGEAHVDIRDVYLGPGPSYPGDCNNDFNVDLADWPLIADCLAGPDVPHATECACANADGDTDVDLKDFSMIQPFFD